MISFTKSFLKTLKIEQNLVPRRIKRLKNKAHFKTHLNTHASRIKEPNGDRQTDNGIA